MSAPGANSTLLAAFTTLADVDSGARQEAVHSLLQLLRDAQKAFEEQSQKLGTLPALPAARPCCNELTYAVGRLTRGITSNNAAARQGYAVALVEAMQTFPNVRVADVMDQLKKATQPGSNASKAEQRDALLGKVFGAIALIRSGRLVDGESTAQGSGTPSGKGAAHNAVVSYVVSELIAAGSRKDWISASASEGLSTLFSLLPWSSWPAVSTAIDGLFPHASNCKEWSAMQLHTALAVEAAWLRWGKSVGTTSPPSCVHKLRSALCTMPQLAGRQGGGEQEGQEGESGSAAGAAEGVPLGLAVQGSAKAMPSLHGLWGLLLRRYSAVLGEAFFGEEAAPTPSSSAHTRDGSAMDEDGEGEAQSKRGRSSSRAEASLVLPPSAYSGLHASTEEALAELTALWKVLVEGCLLRSGPEKKGLALALLESVIRRTGLSPVAQGHASVLLDAWLGPGAVRVLQQHATHKKDPLNKQCHATLKALVAVAEGKPAVASAALVALASRGHTAFDRITHTTTLATLLTQLDGQTLLAHVRALAARFVRPPVVTAAAPVVAEAPSSASKQEKGKGKKGKGGKKGEDEEGEDGVDVSDAALVKAFGSGEADSDDDDEEEAEGGKAAALSPLDSERLQCVDALLSAIRQPSLAVLRDNGTAAALFSLLAFHVSTSVSITSAGTSKAGSNKGAVAVGEGPALAALASHASVAELKPHLARLADAGSSAHGGVSLLVASPPLSALCRSALQAKLAPALREVSQATASAPHAHAQGQGQGHGPTAAGGQQGAGETEEGSRGDRLLKSSQSLLSCCLAVTASLACGAALSSVTSPVAGGKEGGQGGLFSAHTHMAVQQEEEEEEDDEEEEEEEDDDEDDEEEGPELKPAEVCARALTAAQALQSMSRAVPSTILKAAWTPSTGTEDASKKAKAMRRVEALRAVSSYGSLLALLPVVISLGSGTAAVPSPATGGQQGAGAEDGAIEGSVSATKLAEALNDLLIASRTVLAGSVRVLEKAVAAAEQHSSSASTAPASAGKGKRSSMGAAAAGGEATKDFSQAVARLATATADAVLAVGAEDEDDEEEEGGQGDGLHGADKDAAVFFDALLSILAEPSATLREAVKLAARACAGVGAVRHADVLGSVLGVLAHGVGGQPQAAGAGAGGKAGDDEEDDDEDGHGHGKHGHDSDEESITLDAGSSDNPLALLVGGGGRGAAQRPATAGKRRRQEESEASSDEEEESSEEEEEEEEEDEAAIRAGMETHDRMLEGILRMTRAKTNAARDQARRDTHFRFRAYDLLEAAVTRLADGKPGAGAEGVSPGFAPPVLCVLLPSLLEVVRKLSARTRAKKAAGNENAAQDAQKLVDKVCSLLSRACKARVPVLLEGEAQGERGESAAHSQQYAAAGVTVQWALQTLAAALESARSAPTPSALEASGSVASLCLRLLRDPAQVSALPLPAPAQVGMQGQGQGGAVPQPHVSVMEPVVASYASCLHSLLTERHPRVTAAFLRNSLSSYPTLAVRLLPALAGVLSTRPCPVPRAFRVAEAVQLAAALARSAQAGWAASLPCSLPPARAGKAGSKGTGAGNKGGKEAAEATVVATALPTAVSDLCAAIASALRDFSIGPQKEKEKEGLQGGAATAPLVLASKVLRDILEPLRTAQKQGLLALAEGVAAGKELEQLYAALTAVAASTPNEHVRRQSVAFLSHAGQPIPDHAPLVHQGQGEDRMEEEEEEEGQAVLKKDSKGKKQGSKGQATAGSRQETHKGGKPALPRDPHTMQAAKGGKPAPKQQGPASKKHKVAQ